MTGPKTQDDWTCRPVVVVVARADDCRADIHVTGDHKLVLFHDPELGRTTTGNGRIRDQPWTGVLEYVFAGHVTTQ